MVLSAPPKLGSKVEAPRQFEQVGGPVPRALSVLAALGVRVALGGVVADDSAGRLALEELRHRGVDCGAVRVVDEPGRTRAAHVWIEPDGRRTIAYHDTRPGVVEAGDLEHLVDRCRVLHLDGREPGAVVDLAVRARAAGGNVVLDAGGWKEGLERLLPLVDVLVVPADTLRSLRLGQARVAAKRLGQVHRIATVVVTNGRYGALVVEEAVTTHVPAIPVNPLDTNGAGDAMAGGIIFGLLSGCSSVEAVKVGSETAAFLSAHVGDVFPRQLEMLTAHGVTTSRRGR